MSFGQRQFDDVTFDERLFQVFAAATGKAQLPIINPKSCVRSFLFRNGLSWSVPLPTDQHLSVNLYPLITHLLTKYQSCKQNPKPTWDMQYLKVGILVMQKFKKKTFADKAVTLLIGDT